MGERVERFSGNTPRFLADIMLGSLARWLRILGYDVAYDNRISDDEIVRRCLEEDRIALTRDRRLVKRRRLRRYILIRNDPLIPQIREVLEATGQEVDLQRLLSRCLKCNSELRPTSREEVRASVPAYVYRTQHRFKRCPSCRRIYWAGTHRGRIFQHLRTLDVGTSDSKGG